MNEELLGKCCSCGHMVSRKALFYPECQIREPVTNWTYVMIHHSAFVLGIIIIGVFLDSVFTPLSLKKSI